MAYCTVTKTRVESGDLNDYRHPGHDRRLMQERADLPSADQSEPQNSAVANTSPLIESTSSALSWPVTSASSAAALAVASAMASAMASAPRVLAPR